jgi:thiamine pyrophosphokinase
MPAEGGAPVASASPPDQAKASPPAPSTVIVLAGGDEVDPALRAALPPDPAAVIAADSGLASAAPLGLSVDRVVGDLDSVDPALLADARAAGVQVDEYPPDKDRTDLAIAMDTALAASPERILVVGGHGGRLDHFLGNAALLASPDYADVEVVALMGEAHVTVVHGRGDAASRALRGQVGDLVSLVPFHGDAVGVSTSGLRFGLTDATLPAGSSLGVSNEFSEPEAQVSLRAGVLLAVQPSRQ